MRTLSPRSTLTLAALAAAVSIPGSPRPASACDHTCAVRVVHVSSNCQARSIELADDTVLCHSADVYRVRLAGGERVRLAARTRGRVALQVIDSCGHVVAEDEDDELARVELTPRRTELFVVRLVNRDRFAVDYVLTAR